MFDTGRTLLATLGFSLFDPVANAGEAGQALTLSLQAGDAPVETLTLH